MIDERALSLLLAIRARTSARFVHLSQILRNPRTLSAKIRKLESEGLLVSAEGTYRLTEGGLRVAEILEEYTLTVGKRPLLVNFDRVPHSAYSPLLRRYCELLYERYRDSLEGVVLFGSVAKGNWRKESDIDLLLVVKGWEERKAWERIDELYALKARLALSLEHSACVNQGFWPAIHHVPLSPEELKEFRTLYLDISFDGVILFDRDGVMKGFMDSIRSWAKSAGTRRVTLPDGGSYWVMKRTSMGEVVELGKQP